jgi:hypothetical protein
MVVGRREQAKRGRPGLAKNGTDLESVTKRLGAKWGNIIEIGGGVDWKEGGDLKWDASIKIKLPTTRQKD